MVTSDMSHPKVFISYSQDSPEHNNLVLHLSNRLRGDGIDCSLDQYESSPAEGWPRWMDKHIHDSDFVLLVCTGRYYRRVMGDESPGLGLGARWEGNLIYQYIYDAGTTNTRFIPILFSDCHINHVPTPLRGATYYWVDKSEGYEDLLLRLKNQTKIEKPNLGRLKALSIPDWKPDFLVLHWHVPFIHSSFFTGRKAIIAKLNKAFNENQTGLSVQALSGIGGVGKTQIALEYAYRHRDDYQAVFWIRADSELDFWKWPDGLTYQKRIPKNLTKLSKQC
jgi:hypothetical protein